MIDRERFLASTSRSSYRSSENAIQLDQFCRHRRRSRPMMAILLLRRPVIRPKLNSLNDRTFIDFILVCCSARATTIPCLIPSIIPDRKPAQSMLPAADAPLAAILDSREPFVRWRGRLKPLERTVTDDALANLTSPPLTELRPQWRVARQAKLLDEARAAEARGRDEYWAWAAARLHWRKPWEVVRQGGFSDIRYFAGGYLNIAENCVDRHANDPATGTRHAIIWEGENGEVRRLTYRDLLEQVCRCANALHALGVQRGDVVAIHLPNLPEAFVAIQACNRIGAIYTILFSGFSPEALALRLQASRASVVITADATLRRGRQVPLLQNMRQARQRSASIKHTIVVNRIGDQLVLEQNETVWGDLLSKQEPACPNIAMEANDPAFLIFTSGTENRPKGMVHSVAGSLIGAWTNVQWQVGPQADDVYWCAADVGWLTFPLQAAVGGLAHGMTLVCYEGALDFPDRTRLLDTAQRHGVTKILVAPTSLRMLRAAGDAAVQERRPPHLRLVTTQGEPLDPDTAEWTMRVMNVPIVNAYGQTETGSTWAYPIYGVDPIKSGSCGSPTPGHACAVVDDDGLPVRPGLRGNLVLTEPFPALARTIWDEPDRFRSTYFERFPGSYATADEAVLDRDGQLWVLGRADDVINVAAHRISTMEIESLASSHPDVIEAAVVGIKDPLRGTLPVAFVTLRAEARTEEARDGIARAIEQGIGKYARLSDVYVSTNLPKTRSGKVMRRLLREAAETGSITGDLAGLEDHSSLEAVLAAVRRTKREDL